MDVLEIWGQSFDRLGSKLLQIKAGKQENKSFKRVCFTVDCKLITYLYDFKTVIEKEFILSSFPCCRHCYRENDGSKEDVYDFLGDSNEPYKNRSRADQIFHGGWKLCA